MKKFEGIKDAFMSLIRSYSIHAQGFECSIPYKNWINSILKYLILKKRLKFRSGYGF
jgi:hypothetical protein